MFQIRVLNFFGFFIALASMLIAYFYFQEHLGLEPCNLCLLQRAAMIGTGIFFLLVFLHNPYPFSWARRFYAVLTSIGSLAGIGVAWRHIWLQSLPPDQVPACTGDLSFLMEIKGIGGMLEEILLKSGSCAVIDWSLFGLSIPAWVLMTFGLLLLISLIQLFRRS